MQSDADSSDAAFGCRVCLRGNHVGSDRSIARMSQAASIEGVEKAIIVSKMKLQKDEEESSVKAEARSE